MAGRACGKSAFSFVQHQARGPGSGSVMSWVNTPMGSLLGISGREEGTQQKRHTGGQMWVCVPGKWILSASDLRASVQWASPWSIFSL